MDQETAGALVKAADDLLPIVREGAEATGALDVVREKVGKYYDKARLDREVNHARLVVAAAEQIRASGLPVQAVRDNLVRAVLEAGAEEDEPDLQAAWINLLANALTDAAPIPRAFPEIMRQLEPAEARVLAATATAWEEHLPGSWVEMHELGEVPDEIEWRHLDNLERLNLLTFETSLPNNVELPERPRRDDIDVRLRLTPMGESFLRACSPLSR